METMLGEPEKRMAAKQTTPRVGSALFARAAIVSVILFTIVTVGLIGWRWYHVRFPNALLVVRGSEISAGAEVVVQNEAGQEVFRGLLTSDTQYQVVALVEQGGYIVKVQRGGVALVEDRTYVPNGSGVLIQVEREKAGTNPATLPVQAARSE
jgi:hypothetical protein